MADVKAVATAGTSTQTQGAGGAQGGPQEPLQRPENAGNPGAMFDVRQIVEDFPLLCQGAQDARLAKGGKRLVYLDSAASSQLPQSVLDAMERYYETTHANVHRGVYKIAEAATQCFEDARARIGRFVGAPLPSREIVFTRNATEAVNLVAYSWARDNLSENDTVLLTEMEHHANMVPWHILARERGVKLRFLQLTDDGELVLDSLDEMLDGVKLVGVTLMSNVLGTLNPVAEIAEAAHSAGALVIADGAQYVPHLPTDVTSIGCDFLVLSGHKMLGPTGVGVLWARADLLDRMRPFMGGGEMISDVRLDGFEATEPPWRFEAGTPPIAEAVGLRAAVDYLESLQMQRVREHDRALTAYAMDALDDRYGQDITIFGPRDPTRRGAVLSLSFMGIHPHDLSQILDDQGICVRAGHHCAKPLMRRLGVPATTRASFYVYNDTADADALVDGLAEAARLFG